MAAGRLALPANLATNLAFPFYTVEKLDKNPLLLYYCISSLVQFIFLPFPFFMGDK